VVTKSKYEYFWLLLPIAFAAWSISRVWTVLPSIMGDEYIYTTAAKHLPFAEQYFSNYLFSWVMSVTNTCGPVFYVCTKGVNSVFFALAILFSFLIAARFLTFGWAVFVASVTALSPIAIPVSYFMPEMMYFAVMTGVVLLALWVADKDKWHLWILVGMSLGLAALVKPHAIFMLPAFSIFSLIVSYKLASGSWKAGIRSAGSTILGFFISKLGLGFLFAGTEGLKLFGGYGSPLEALNSAIENQTPTVSQEAGTQATGLELLASVTFAHLAMHLAAVLMIAGLPILLSLRVLLSVAKKPDPVGPVSSLFVLVGLITFSMIAVVAAFEAHVTVGGDDHSYRLILRYYEFLIPQFIVMGLLLPRFTDSKLAWRIVQGSIVALAALFFSIFYPANFNQQYADSSTLPGLAASGGLFIAVAVAISAAILYWIFMPEEGNVLMGRFIIPLFLIVALALSQSKLIEINGTPAYFDQAGWVSRAALQDVPGERIIVIGQTRTEVFTVKFWIDEPHIKDLLILEGSVVPIGNVSESDYAVTLGNIGIDFPHEVVTEGDGYKIVKIVR
jgi:phosphoglycerol transferase